MFGIKVIVETIFDSRPDTKFGAREQFLYSLCQNMRSTVTECFTAFSIVKCINANGAVCSDWLIQAHHFIVYFCNDGFFGKPVADIFCNFQRSYNILFKSSHRTVW